MTSSRNTKTAEMVLYAIQEIGGGTQGVTPEAIVDYITKEYQMPEKTLKRNLDGALERGVAFGALRRVQGKYSLGPALDKLRQSRRRRRRRRGGRRRRSRSRSRRRRRRRSGSQ